MGFVLCVMLISSEDICTLLSQLCGYYDKDDDDDD